MLSLGKYIGGTIEINAAGYVFFLINVFLHCGLVASLFQ